MAHRSRSYRETRVDVNQTRHSMHTLLSTSLLRAGLIAVVGSFVVGCVNTDERLDCEDYEGSNDEIRRRVVGNERLDSQFAVKECVSRKGMNGEYEEACLVEADARAKPAFDNSWQRELITFKPIIVSEMAESHDIVLAVAFIKDWNGARIYADDDSSRSIMYRRFDPCGP